MDSPKHLEKKLGKTKKRRAINGYILDMSAAAQFLGATEKTLRALVERRVIPFRRLNRRIIFLKEELEQFIRDLPGVTMEEARSNLGKRGTS